MEKKIIVKLPADDEQYMEFRRINFENGAQYSYTKMLNTDTTVDPDKSNQAYKDFMENFIKLETIRQDLLVKYKPENFIINRYNIDTFSDFIVFWGEDAE